MPKNSSGRKEQVPIEYQWATFCRQIVVDAGNQQESSLIGVLQGLNVAIDSKETKVEMPMLLWVHAVFKFLEITDRECKYTISAKVSAPNRDPYYKQLEITHKPKQDFISMNIQLLMNIKGSGVILTCGKNLFKISFRYKDTDLGMIELPINVTFSTSSADT